MVNIRLRGAERASRIGIHTEGETYRQRTSVPCSRCGVQRTIRPERPHGDLCRDCRWTDPNFGKKEK